MPLETEGQNAAADAVAAGFPWLALFDGDPGGAGVEITGNGYARQQVTFAAASAGTPGEAEATNLPLTFPIAGGQSVSHWRLYSAQTAGSGGAYTTFPETESYTGDGTYDVNSLVLDPLA